jgi:hypothetical protein
MLEKNMVMMLIMENNRRVLLVQGRTLLKALFDPFEEIASGDSFVLSQYFPLRVVR